MSPAKRAALGIVRLPARSMKPSPRSTPMQRSRAFLPERLLRAYIGTKRAEFARSAGWSPGRAL